MIKQLLVILPILLSIGCSTIPETNEQVYSASYLGDHKSYELDSFIVSVKNVRDEMANLHISFTAVVNPNKSFISSTTYSELSGLIQRLETRIKMQLITKALSLDPKVVSNSQKLHKELLAEAQSIFDSEYSKWKKSSYFDVKIAITSLYFTDLSVGKAVNSRRW